MFVQAVRLLSERPELCVQVEGHADQTEPEAIAEARARAVREVLVSRGIDAARISTQSYGTARPIAPNATPAGRAHNRRTEFRVVDCPASLAPSTPPAKPPK